LLQIDALISRLGLQTCADRLIGSGISSGELKKTALAVELVTSPGVILLDEPVSDRPLFRMPPPAHLQRRSFGRNLFSCKGIPLYPHISSTFLLISVAVAQTSGLDSSSAFTVSTLLQELSSQGTSAGCGRDVPRDIYTHAGGLATHPLLCAPLRSACIFHIFLGINTEISPCQP